MIPYNPNPKPVRVGYWHHERPKFDGSKMTSPSVKEVRFDSDKSYTGLLHGFGVEGEPEELYCFALVEKPDGTFDTPSVTVIQLIK